MCLKETHVCISVGWKKFPVLGLAGGVSGVCVVPAVLVAVLWNFH